MASGTAIAQAASGIVLRDDNFVGVGKDCMWGRNADDSIKKFLQLQGTVNTVGVALTFFGAALVTTMGLLSSKWMAPKEANPFA